MSGKLSRLLRSLFVPGSLRARSAERWCYADPHASGAYNHQLLRSRAEGDFVRHPDLLWSPTPYWTARSGLNAHFRELAQRLDGAVYSDVLIVLNREDFARTRASWLESWDRAAEEELADCWARLVEAQGWTLAMPDRRFHLKVVADGDSKVGDLQLEPGEFATGLLPNLYLGPDAKSAPLVEVFARSEGDTFRSLGTMYTDQLAFSVGAHGLDNGQLQQLGDSAVYTVHRFPSEAGLHHKINPERADRVALETGEAHGGETIRVVDRGRGKLLVEVMLVSAKHPAAEFEVGSSANRPLLDLPGLGLFGPAPGTILPEGVDLGTIGAMSIIPDALPEPLHTLSERAFLLQRVHFRSVMRGYRMQIERSGRVAPRGLDSVATLEVLDDLVRLTARTRDLSVDGRPLQEGDSVELVAEHAIAWRGGSLDYRSVRREDRRWPYLARLESPRRSVPLFAGSYVLGRDREACDISLPDRPTAENIVWRDGKTEGPVDVRGGVTERTSFRTDAICVATKAASLDLTGNIPTITNLSGSCAIHVLRADATTIRLKKDSVLPLLPGDELLIGNQVFAVLPPGAATAPIAGVAGVPRHTQIGPVHESQRHEGGPGSKGRRPLVGGARGHLVASENTYAALLGLSPATDRTVSPELEVMSLSLDPSAIDASIAVPAFGPGPTRADDWSAPPDGFDEVEDIPVLLDLFEYAETPTIIGDFDILGRIIPIPAASSPADLPKAVLPSTPPKEQRRAPRGLQIGVAEPTGGFGTLRRRSGALPGLSHLLPPRSSVFTSAQGD